MTLARRHHAFRLTITLAALLPPSAGTAIAQNPFTTHDSRYTQQLVATTGLRPNRPADGGELKRRALCNSPSPSGTTRAR